MPRTSTSKGPDPTWDKILDVTDILGQIAKVFGTLTPEQQKTLTALFMDEESTRKTLLILVQERVKPEDLPAVADVKPTNIAGHVKKKAQNVLTFSQDVTEEQLAKVKETLADEEKRREKLVGLLDAVIKRQKAQKRG